MKKKWVKCMELTKTELIVSIKKAFEIIGVEQTAEIFERMYNLQKYKCAEDGR